MAPADCTFTAPLGSLTGGMETTMSTAVMTDCRSVAAPKGQNRRRLVLARRRRGPIRLVSCSRQACCIWRLPGYSDQNPRLSMMTTSPARNVGAKPCCTQAKNISPVMGPSKSHGAQGPSRRMPEINVLV